MLEDTDKVMIGVKETPSLVMRRAPSLLLTRKLHSWSTTLPFD